MDRVSPRSLRERRPLLELLENRQLLTGGAVGTGYLPLTPIVSVVHWTPTPITAAHLSLAPYLSLAAQGPVPSPEPAPLPAPQPSPGPAPQPQPQPITFGQFRVFSAMLSQILPDVAAAGLLPMRVSYADLYAVNPDGSLDDTRLDETKVRAFARAASDAGVPWVVDIEHWPIDIQQASQSAVQETMNKLSQLIDWAKDERPDVQIGLYDIGPVRNYWAPVTLQHVIDQRLLDPTWDPTGSQLAQALAMVDAWKASNDFLRPLMAKVDFVVPSLYTFYNEPDDWLTFAEANVAEARRYGKPVVPFLWPMFHDSNPELVGQVVPSAFWRLQLQTMLRLADSVTIWGGQQMHVNPQDPWWQQTLDFLHDENLVA